MNGGVRVIALLALLTATAVHAAGEAERPRAAATEVASGTAKTGKDGRRAATAEVRQGSHERSGSGRSAALSATGASGAGKPYSPDPKSLGLGCASGED